MLCAGLLARASAEDGIAAQEKTPVAGSDKAHPPQLSGTVVDTRDAVIAGATVQVRSANGTVQRTTQSDTNGSFILSGLPAGDYRLVVSNPGFETKEILVTIGTTGAPAPLRISLVVGSVSTTVNVQGRADDLIGIASSAGQVTVGAEELKNRPLLRSGEILEALPGLIITQHAGGGKANQYFHARLQSRPRHGLRHLHRRYAAEPAVARAWRGLLGHEHRHPGVCGADGCRERSLLRRSRRLWLGGKCPRGVFTRRCPRTSSRSTAACTSLRGSFSASRASSARATCCTAEKPITMAAHGCIRTITTNSTDS